MIDTIVCDLDKAPPHIRREIQAMGNKGTHSFEDYQKLSQGTQQWLREQAHENQGALQDKIRKHYVQMTKEVHFSELGITAMSAVMEEAEAKQMNLDLYNACASFCREYVKESMP